MVKEPVSNYALTAGHNRAGLVTLPRWPLFGCTRALNAAAYRGLVSTIWAGHQSNEQVTGAADTVYGSEGWVRSRFGREVPTLHVTTARRDPVMACNLPALCTHGVRLSAQRRGRLRVTPTLRTGVEDVARTGLLTGSQDAG
jgi:hypothetical protein